MRQAGTVGLVLQGREHVWTKFGGSGCLACSGTGTLAIMAGTQDACGKEQWVVEGLKIVWRNLDFFI